MRCWNCRCKKNLSGTIINVLCTQYLYFVLYCVLSILYLGVKMDANAFWANIKTLLKQKKMTQKDLAAACHMPVKTLQSWIYHGIYPSFVDGCHIAWALGITVEEMLNIKKPKRETPRQLEKIRSTLRQIEKRLGEIKMIDK